jgi:hypothetical protein
LKNNKDKIIQVFKWVWIAIVFIGAAVYLQKHYQEIAVHFREIAAWRLFIAFVMLVAGKMILADLSRWSAAGEGWTPPYTKMLSVSAVTQLGKYLPGGIWHFVGKFGIYRANGMNNKQATKAMLVENFWLLGSAFMIGATAMAAFSRKILCQVLSQKTATTFPEISLQIAAILLPILWIVSLIMVEQFAVAVHTQNRWEKLIRILADQVFTWVLFGLSLWVLFPETDLNLIGLTLGTFSISWAAGYVTVFAPGGIGIREILLTTLLGVVFSIDRIVAYAAVHRLLWTAAEVALGLASGLLFGFPKFEKDNQGKEQEVPG